METLITVLSLCGIILHYKYVTAEQRHKNYKKWYGKNDLKDTVKQGYFDKQKTN